MLAKRPGIDVQVTAKDSAQLLARITLASWLRQRRTGAAHTTGSRRSTRSAVGGSVNGAVWKSCHTGSVSKRQQLVAASGITRRIHATSTYEAVEAQSVVAPNQDAFPLPAPLQAIVPSIGVRNAIMRVCSSAAA
jgi:hypothetical protein